MFVHGNVSFDMLNCVYNSRLSVQLIDSSNEASETAEGARHGRQRKACCLYG